MRFNSKLGIFLCVAIVISIALHIADLALGELSILSERTIKTNRYYEKTNEIERSFNTTYNLMKEDEKETEHDHSYDNDTTNSQTEFTCAPWIPIENRKIVMMSCLKRFVTWDLVNRVF